MDVRRSATVAVRVDMSPEHGGLTAQWRIKRVVLRCDFVVVPVIDAVPVVSVIVLG
jgi:hypothetical protein